MLDASQISDLKNWAIASLLAGSGAAILRHFPSTASPRDRYADVGQTGDESIVEVPAPGQVSLPNTRYVPGSRKRSIKDRFNSGRKMLSDAATSIGKIPIPFTDLDLKSGLQLKIAKKMSVKAAFEWRKDLSNPAYIPAAVVATALPGFLGYHAIKAIMENKEKADEQNKINEAKQEFDDALAGAAMSKEVAPGSPAMKRANTLTGSLSDDLEKLACMCLEGVTKEATLWDSVMHAGGKTLSSVGSGLAEGFKAIPLPNLGIDLSDITQGVKDTLGGYSGLIGGLALGMGGLGLYTGYNRAKYDDPDKLRSEQYINEMLQRKELEDKPIYSIPIPISEKGKKKRLIGDTYPLNGGVN